MAGEIIGLLSENEIETEEALFALAGSIAFILCTFNKREDAFIRLFNVMHTIDATIKNAEGSHQAKWQKERCH